MKRRLCAFLVEWEIGSSRESSPPRWGNQACRIGLILFFVPSVLFAGGPTTVLPGAMVARWDETAPVPFIIDQGLLGIITNEQGVQMVQEAFQAWQDVSTASVFFSNQGLLPMDVDLSNYEAFLMQNHEENPIIFDTDGRITDALLGVGTRQTVAGFTSIPTVNLATQRYVVGFIALNGVIATLSLPQTTRQLIIHEIGHLIGLDHTQAGHSLAQDTLGFNDQFVPLMYPFLLSQGPPAPIRDDIAWLSWLYPEPGFASDTGTITGRVRRRTGGPLPAANVVAVGVDGEMNESL